VPDELLTAHIVEKTGWTVQQIRTTPQHELDKLIFYWHLQSVADKANDRKNKPPKKSGKP
jgi:hypothetical protein